MDENGEPLVVYHGTNLAQITNPLTNLQVMLVIWPHTITQEHKQWPKKQAQFDLLSKTNSMRNDYHTGIRSVYDVKTFQEAYDEVKAASG